MNARTIKKLMMRASRNRATGRTRSGCHVTVRFPIDLVGGAPPRAPEIDGMTLAVTYDRGYVWKSTEIAPIQRFLEIAYRETENGPVARFENKSEEDLRAMGIHEYGPVRDEDRWGDITHSWIEVKDYEGHLDKGGVRAKGPSSASLPPGIIEACKATWNWWHRVNTESRLLPVFDGLGVPSRWADGSYPYMTKDKRYLRKTFHLRHSDPSSRQRFFADFARWFTRARQRGFDVRIAR